MPEITGTHIGVLQEIVVLDLTASFAGKNGPGGDGREPPLTLFDYQQLLLGIEFVPYVPHEGPIHTFDGSAFEVSKVKNN